MLVSWLLLEVFWSDALPWCNSNERALNSSFVGILVSEKAINWIII